MTIAKATILKRGTQIAYIPLHAKGNINHPDVQFGFVTSGPTSTNAYFCRYWTTKVSQDLRTKANSELTPAEMMYEYPLFSDELIDRALKEYC